MYAQYLIISPNQAKNYEHTAIRRQILHETSFERGK